MATHGPIPPSPSSDCLNLSGCQVSLPRKDRALAIITSKCHRVTLVCASEGKSEASVTSDAAVTDPHQPVFGSLVARHQVVDLWVDSNFLPS